MSNVPALVPRHEVAQKGFLQRVLSVTSLACDRDGIPQEGGTVTLIESDYFLVDLARKGESNTVFAPVRLFALLAHPL
jgi:hypothetical protein